MKKSIGVILLIALFVISSCSMDKVTKFMGDMGNNVMGDYINTETANSIKDSASNAKTEEVKNEGGKLTVSLGGKDFTFESSANVTTMLAGITDSEKNKLVDQVTSASTNEKNKENLLKAMNEPVKEEQKEAAKGTATIVSSLMDQISVDELGLGEKVKETLKALSDSMKKISDADTISAGDVPFALQMMTSLVEKVADKTVIGEDGTITSVDLESGLADLASDALQTVTVIQAISSATTVNIGDITGLLSSIPGSSGEGTRSRAVEEGIVLDPLLASSVRVIYDAYSKIFPNGIDKGNEINTVSLHRTAIDLYVNFSEDNTLDKNVCNLDSIIQYTLATVFSVANNEYPSVAKEVFETVPADTLDGLINLYIKANPWILDEELEAKFEEPTGTEFKEGFDFASLVNPILKKMVSSAYSIQKMAGALNLSQLEGFSDYIEQLPKFCKTGLSYEWKSNN